LKFLILVGDGMADFPLPELGGRTPLEAAATPGMDAVARAGQTGLFYPVPDGLPAGSDIGNLSLFGYNPRETYTGRAPLEAANQGIRMSADQVAFRCNLVTLRDGLMEDFTSEHISSQEAAELIAHLNDCLSSYPVRFYPGVSYRHLSIVAAGPALLENLVRLECTPPHDITGKPYESYLPSGAGADLILDLMTQSMRALEGHAVNQARFDAGKRPATSIWLWGQGRPATLASYASRFGVTGAVISAVDLVKGIGVCAGLEVLDVPGATGYLDTNYEGKVEAALAALERVDFVFVHVEAPDETSHEGRIDLKIRAIEEFDSRVVAPCLDYASTRPDIRLLVTPDHVTSIQSRTHAGGAVPFAMCGNGIAAGGISEYSEVAAQTSGIRIADGYRLVPCFVTCRQIDGAMLNDLGKE
jgi:2,3-bisphosphoglycerate-independent phosphoglycerate mutase